MNEQELNEKLAKRAGLHRNEPTGGFWWDKDGNEIFNFHNPNEKGFTQSLDTCFKWLVPLVIEKIMAEQECSSDIAYAILFKKWLQELELIIPKAALALCLAIGKLIEQDVDNTKQ